MISLENIHMSNTDHTKHVIHSYMKQQLKKKRHEFELEQGGVIRKGLEGEKEGKVKLHYNPRKKPQNY